jgi:hypothetical protein
VIGLAATRPSLLDSVEARDDTGDVLRLVDFDESGGAGAFIAICPSFKILIVL